MPDTFASFNAKLDTLEKTFGAMPLARIGNKVKAEVDKAVRSDIGDLSMSGWNRGKPIQISGRSKVLSKTSFEVTSTAGGPMRVLQVGRNQGNASGFSGPGLNHKTGVTSRTKSGALRKVRATRGRRRNGRTAGKGTWDDARTAMEKQVPVLLHEELEKTLVRLFGRG